MSYAFEKASLSDVTHALSSKYVSRYATEASSSFHSYLIQQNDPEINDSRARLPSGAAHPLSIELHLMVCDNLTLRGSVSYFRRTASG
jgi:hypothetical protein